MKKYNLGRTKGMELRNKRGRLLGIITGYATPDDHGGGDYVLFILDSGVYESEMQVTNFAEVIDLTTGEGFIEVRG